MNIFGNENALIGSIDLFIGAIFVLGSLIFRKSVANDILDRGFSVIGSCTLGIITYLIINGLFDNIRLSIGASILACGVGGFLLAEIIMDGESGGSD